MVYKGEIESLLNTMRSQGLKTQNQLIAPSVNGRWPFEEVMDTGLLTDFGNDVGILTVEKYAEFMGSFHQFSEVIYKVPE